MTDHGPVGALSMAKIVRSVMVPYEARVEIDGDETLISAQAMTTVALILHELATNSMKYGALSSQPGSLGISWEREGHMVSLRWAERGGPRLDRAPDRRGFGTAVIDRSIKGAETRYPRTGGRTDGR